MPESATEQNGLSEMLGRLNELDRMIASLRHQHAELDRAVDAAEDERDALTAALLRSISGWYPGGECVIRGPNGVLWQPRDGRLIQLRVVTGGFDVLPQTTTGKGPAPLVTAIGREVESC